MNAVRLRSGAGPEAADHLDRNDAYNFFKLLGRSGGAGHHLHQRSFITGTVFSDPVGAKLGVFSDAQAQGCTVVLIFIGIRSAARNAATSASSKGRSPWRPRCCRRGGARSPAPAAADLELSTAAAGARLVALGIAATARALRQPLRSGWCGKGGTETGVLQA